MNINIQISNLADNKKMKDIGNLSIPSALYYRKDNNNCDNTLDTVNSLNNIVNDFSCRKHECCVDKDIYYLMVDNIRITKPHTVKYNKRKSRRNPSIEKRSNKTTRKKNKIDVTK